MTDENKQAYLRTLEEYEKLALENKHLRHALHIYASKENWQKNPTMRNVHNQFLVADVEGYHTKQSGWVYAGKTARDVLERFK